MKKICIFCLLIVLGVSCSKGVKDSSTTNALSTEKSKNDARAKLEGYRKLVLSGEMSMEVAAARYSEDPGSAKEGGLYKDIKRGDFVPEFETAAFSLKVGEISEIFESKYGFHFVQLVARKGESIDARHILVVPK